MKYTLITYKNNKLENYINLESEENVNAIIEEFNYLTLKELVGFIPTSQYHKALKSQKWIKTKGWACLENEVIYLIKLEK